MLTRLSDRLLPSPGNKDVPAGAAICKKPSRRDQHRIRRHCRWHLDRDRCGGAGDRREHAGHVHRGTECSYGRLRSAKGGDRAPLVTRARSHARKWLAGAAARPPLDADYLRGLEGSSLGRISADGAAMIVQSDRPAQPGGCARHALPRRSAPKGPLHVTIISNIYTKVDSPHCATDITAPATAATLLSAVPLAFQTPRGARSGDDDAEHAVQSRARNSASDR